jgi:hypothetical protein
MPAPRPGGPISNCWHSGPARDRGTQPTRTDSEQRGRASIQTWRKANSDSAGPSRLNPADPGRAAGPEALLAAARPARAGLGSGGIRVRRAAGGARSGVPPVGSEGVPKRPGRLGGEAGLGGVGAGRRAEPLRGRGGPEGAQGRVAGPARRRRQRRRRAAAAAAGPSRCPPRIPFSDAGVTSSPGSGDSDGRRRRRLGADVASGPPTAECGDGALAALNADARRRASLAGRQGRGGELRVADRFLGGGLSDASLLESLSAAATASSRACCRAESWAGYRGGVA